MRLQSTLVIGIACTAGAAWAMPPPLLGEKDVAALANELSGETAKATVEALAQLHRQRGSRGFHSAAELVVERARSYGLSGVQILSFPADGRIFYGTQRSRPAWDAEEGELSEIVDGKEVRIASYAAEPVVLAQDSESADVTAELVDVGGGSKEADYAGKDVRGKLVLVASQPGAAQELAIGKFHAAGLVSFAQNQKTAWWGDDDRLIRWGHLGSFSPNKTFAFMVSLKTARGLQERLRGGDRIRLHARVKAGSHPGAYEVVTAVIEGADRSLKEQEIVFSCHLDHQRPGANDNASGCATNLEVARTLRKLIDAGKLAQPARTIRFVWPPEIEGTLALLNGRPDLTKRIKAVVHLDMVGGGPETEAVFHLTRGPLSLPSFVHDVAWSFAAWVNEQSYRFAASGKADYPLVAPAGGKEPLRAEYSAYSIGSDHEVYQDSSFAIPAVYMNDWPDRYIHTNFDSAANIDPTKLKRAAFITAATGYFLANVSASDTAAVKETIAAGRLHRALLAMARCIPAGPADEYERGIDASLPAFLSGTQAEHPSSAPSRAHDASKPKRATTPRGPLAVFGYDYFADHAQSTDGAKPGLLEYEGQWGTGEEYAYELLNFSDGTRTPSQICKELSAEFGPVPLELVVQYQQALKRIGVLE